MPPKRAAAATAAKPAPAPWRGPGRAGESLAVQVFPTFLLERVAALARRKLTRAYLDPWALSVPEWRVLHIVARFSPTSFPDIARVSTMDKAQISLTLRRLVARGWIAMAANGAGRRAARPVTITPSGRAVIAKILPTARRAQMRLLDRLSPAERRQFHALLKKAIAILDEE